MKPLITAALLLPFSSLVFAQNTEETNAKPTAELEQIVVYGEKQDKNLQDVATSVQVIDSTAIEQSTMQDFNDVFARTANVASLREGNETVFSIRGISIYGLSDNPSAYTSSVYVDDVPLNMSSIRYGAMGLWDTQQIEVYRGPQGTMQGRNSLAGAIYIKTQDPSYEAGGHAQAYYGSDNTTRLSVAGGGAIIDDTLAFRLSVDDYQSDGYVNNTTRNEDDYAGFERRNYRAKLLFEPSDSVSTLLTLSHIESDVGDNPMARADNPFSFAAQSDYEGGHDVTTDLAALRINWQVNDALTLSSISSLSKDKDNRIDDYDSSALPLGYITQTNKNRLATQEFRLNFDAGNFYGVTGIYASDEKQQADWVVDSKYPKAGVEQTAYTLMMAPPSMGGLGLSQGQADAVWGAIPDLIDLNAVNDSDYRTRNYAIFGEVNYTPSASWLLTLGARYDIEDQQRQQYVDNSVDTVVSSGDPMIDAVANGLLATFVGEESEDTDTDYKAFLPKASVQYFFTPDISTAFSVQKGYRAGGSSVSQISGQIKDFDPESTTNYELAFRNVLMGQRLFVNANIFYTDWKDQQVDVSTSGDARDTYIGNAGQSKLYGLEVELTARVAADWEVFANAGYVKTEFEEFMLNRGGGVEDYKGNEFAGAPNITSTVGVVYQPLIGWFAQADATYQDEAYLDNANTREADSRTLVNAKFGYRWQQVSAYLWGRNIFDKQYIANSWEEEAAIPAVQDYQMPGAPRSIGVSLAVDF